MASYRVKFELATGQSFEALIDGNTKLAPHFKLYEVANTKGKISLAQFVLNANVEQFLCCLEQMRAWFVVKYPAKASGGMKVNSMYRQIAFNKSVGGSSSSLHLRGLALDWSISGLTDADRSAIETEWKTITMSAGLIGGCNWYTNGFHLSVHEDLLGYKNFVHRDYRGKKGDW